MSTTHPQLIKLIKALRGRSFTESDWHCYAGCESEDPHLAEVGDLVVVADGNTLEIIEIHPDTGGGYTWTDLKVVS